MVRRQLINVNLQRRKCKFVVDNSIVMEDLNPDAYSILDYYSYLPSNGL